MKDDAMGNEMLRSDFVGDESSVLCWSRFADIIKARLSRP